MAKFIHDAVIDVALNVIKNYADKMHICAGQPTDYADVASRSKGNVALDSSDFTLADGDISGRKITVGAQTITPDADGTVDHVVLVDVSESAIIAIDTIPSKAVVNGVNVSIEAFDLWEIRDPS
jgi:hypothetical protein